MCMAREQKKKNRKMKNKKYFTVERRKCHEIELIKRESTVHHPHTFSQALSHTHTYIRAYIDGQDEHSYGMKMR